jgi:DNA-binding SARP family transcriptional activator/tetratricopeptide (TPR) repeat protein
MLRLWLCGKFAAEFGGEPLPVPASDRVRALIGWLALHPGTHSRAHLAARLWPDVPDASARASLRTAIWSVRQAWGQAADEVLEGSRNSVGLRGDLLWVDALATRTENAAEGEAAGPPAGPPAGLDAGELLPGVDDDWAVAARAEHRSRLLRNLEEQAAQADREGRTADAADWSRRRCALAPLDEAAHRDLLRRLLADGDRAGAVLATRQFSQLLREELGVRPSPATRAVQSQLHAPAAVPPRTRLFGRSAELTSVTAAWQAAAGGQGQVLVLTGEAGIGKTSLLAELAHRAGTAGGRIAIGAGLDVGGETPFAAWLELARALVLTVSPVPAGASWPAELSRLSQELGVRLGRPEQPPAVAAPELERLRVFESVLRLVEWSCADRPALIALDDAHRADRASLRLTAHIGRRLAGLPVLLVLTRRDRPSRPELDALLADLAGRAVRITELDVGPIADRDVAALASSVLRLDDDALGRVIAAAEGNPLLAVESVRTLAAGGTAPPPNLRTAVRAALGVLPPPARTLAGLLSVAGRPLARSEVDGLGLASLPAAEEAALECGLLIRTGGRLGFRHGLLREAVYADLADPASLHDRVAVALDPGDRAGIARHLTAAGRTAEAAGHWAAAARYARSVGALTEAAEFLSRATECAPGDGGLWLELQEVWAWLGRRDLMEQAWERALALLTGQELPQAWCRRGYQLRTIVCYPAASFEAYRTAQALLTPQSPAGLRAETLIGLAWGEAVAGDAAAVDGLLAAAGTPAEAGAEMAADIAEIRIQGLIRQGRFAECAAVAATAAPAAVLGGMPSRAFAVWINAACALACAGDYEAALAFADRAAEATRTTPVLLAGCLAARAHLLSRLGRHDQASEVVRQQRDCADRVDDPDLAATAAHDAGLVALAAGRYEQAAELLGQALAGGARISRPAAALARAEALARAGDPAAAAVQLRAAVVEPVGRADQSWALVPRMTAIQGLIAAAGGDATLARRRYDEAAAGWERIAASVPAYTAEGYLANLVDLGRPPVVGLVEPARELARIAEDRAALTSTRPRR